MVVFQRLASFECVMTACACKPSPRKVTRTMLRKCAKSAKTVTALFMSLLLSVMMVPVSAYAQPAKTQTMERPTPSQIQDMLSGRTYIEGDAIVVAEAGANLSVARAGESLESEGLTEVSDTAMELTAESAKSSKAVGDAASTDTMRRCLAETQRRGTLPTR